MLAPDLSTHGMLARQTTRPAAVQRLSHELKEATEAQHPCNSLLRTALPSVAVVVQVSWVPANKLRAHPLETHKKNMESTKLSWAAGATECTLCCMDGFAPVVTTPERLELCLASIRTTPNPECERSVRLPGMPWLQAKLAPAAGRLLQQCAALQVVVSNARYEY